MQYGCSHHQYICNWTAVILQQVLMAVRRKALWKNENAKDCYESDVVARDIDEIKKIVEKSNTLETPSKMVHDTPRLKTAQLKLQNLQIFSFCASFLN